ncbi:hypothetical protein M426DRAFT_198009 [Hypoxylon sp. CI-4A]|nr:hypothetical protein M426DRAFT_198009 [Hypoxylon sp. CI-4A]
MLLVKQDSSVRSWLRGYIVVVVVVFSVHRYNNSVIQMRNSAESVRQLFRVADCHSRIVAEKPI